MRDNDHLVFTVDSDDMWVKLKLFMTLKSYLLEAELDLKINKQMPWRKFLLLLQKIALDTWNKCFNNVFEEQRAQEI